MRRAALLLLALAAVPACNVRDPRLDRRDDAVRMTGGDPDRGQALIAHYGCASCHTMPGFPGSANVGPPLDRVGSRVYIGGVLLNNPDNMMRWLKNPPEVDPKTAMPSVGATDDEVRDIACYLYLFR